jgi:tetratricopeptide (TPR) repeat protein
MIPANAVREIATTHGLLGVIYADARRIDTALRHFHESIRYFEAMEDRFSAGKIRFNAGRTLGLAGRLTDAREWARSALRDYQACGKADQEVVDTLKLLEQIESDLRASAPLS